MKQGRRQTVSARRHWPGQRSSTASDRLRTISPPMSRFRGGLRGPARSANVNAHGQVPHRLTDFGMDHGVERRDDRTGIMASAWNQKGGGDLSRGPANPSPLPPVLGWSFGRSRWTESTAPLFFACEPSGNAHASPPGDLPGSLAIIRGNETYAVAWRSRWRALRPKNNAWLTTAETTASWNGLAIRKAGSGRLPVRNRSG